MLASIRMGRADGIRLHWRVAAAALLASLASFASLVVLESPAAAAPVAPGTVANPTLPAQCGLKVMLVVDSSGSIGGAATQVTGAVSAFLDQLTDTGSEVGVVDFDTQVNDVVPYTPVTPANVAGVFQDYLDGYSVGGGTNWAAALNKARTVPTGGDLPDLVLFLTDGRPTYRGGYVGPAGPIALTDDGDGSQTSGPERVEAANRADEIKTQGTHMFLVGVGNTLGNPSAGDLQSIQAVTGNQQYPTSTTNIGAADYSLIANFGALAEAFRQLVYAICDTSVTVTKLVDANNDGVGEPANGYSITGTVQTVNGGANAFTWSQPLPATPAVAPNARTPITAGNGTVTFQWTPGAPGNPQPFPSTFVITEPPQAGTEFVSGTCTIKSPGVPVSTSPYALGQSITVPRARWCRATSSTDEPPRSRCARTGDPRPPVTVL